MNEAEAEKEFMDIMEYIFTAPLIEHPMSSFPEPMAADHILYRLLEGPKCVEQQLCTGYEALGYLSCTSLVGPLDTNLTDTMQHLFNKYYPSQAFGEEDARIKNLNADCERSLHSLRAWIFKKQIQHIKQGRKASSSQAAEKLKRAQHTLADFENINTKEVKT